ncbi:YncE family protein [Caldovatus aquaticus]|uniref:Beta-propeller fold lactonase family protein n=1 Tax=Caldovatus aquaticus TaxID=2865671 RepID=A0ABS7EXE6_9PROT|nr:beta-propeller fold lactonase family protein [Caldovatus aquaticus]MBW8268038.1 beta-propeller fold lactonase family protein [Caldovatus aquaticus]
MRPPQTIRRAALLLALAAPLLGRAGPAGADIVYVLNSGDASITVLDGATREEVRRIPVLRETHHLVLTPDRRSLVVADSGGNELLFLDPATGALQRRERISNPYHLDYSPDGKFLVIASLRRDQVDIYDAEGPTLLQRLRLPDKPSHLAFRPDSRMVYVTLQGSRSVVAISLETRQPVWQAEVGREPAGILWHRGKLIVGIMGADHFAVLDPETRQVERTIPVGRGAHTIFAAPDGRVLYATSRVDSRITALDAATLEALHRWDLPGGPDCIAFDPEGRLWVTLRWIQRVAVIDPRTAQVETIRVGRSPHGIFVQPRGGG